MNTYQSKPLKLALAALVCFCVGITCPVDATKISKAPAKGQVHRQVRSPGIHRKTASELFNERTDVPNRHWDKKCMPLRVYFEPVAKGVWRYKPHYPKIMRQAFQDWTDATHQCVRFQFVDSKPADIRVVYVNVNEDNRDGIAHVNHSDFGAIHSVVIDLAIRKDASDGEVLHTGQHEIGHAIGLNHRKRKGVMHDVGTYPQEFINEEDCNDFKRAYKLDDDFQQYRVRLAKVYGWSIKYCDKKH